MLLVTIKRKTRLMTNDALLLTGSDSMDSGKLDQTWADICAQIKSYNNIDPSQINAFFSRLQPQAMSEGFLMLTADNDSSRHGSSATTWTSSSRRCSTSSTFLSP